MAGDEKTKSDEIRFATSNSGGELRDRIRACANLAGGIGVLAQKSAIPRRTLDSYLAGDSEPTASRLARIAESVGANVEWLLTGAGHKIKNGVSEHHAHYNASGIPEAERLEAATNAVAQASQLDRDDLGDLAVMHIRDQVFLGALAPEAASGLIHAMAESRRNRSKQR